MKTIMMVVAAVALFVFSAPVQAADKGVQFSFETEYTVDPLGFNSTSQYIFVDDAKGKWNFLARYFKVDGTGPEHLEFKGGPNWRLGRDVLLKPNIGLTTDGATTLGCVAVLGQGKVIYILDPKWRGGQLATVFQKVMLPGVIKIGDYPITLRAEHISYYGQSLFLRVGPEFPVCRGKLSVSVSPNYDFISHRLGGMITARF